MVSNSWHGFRQWAWFGSGYGCWQLVWLGSGYGCWQLALFGSRYNLAVDMVSLSVGMVYGNWHGLAVGIA